MKILKGLAPLVGGVVLISSIVGVEAAPEIRLNRKAYLYEGDLRDCVTGLKSLTSSLAVEERAGLSELLSDQFLEKYPEGHQQILRNFLAVAQKDPRALVHIERGRFAIDPLLMGWADLAEGNSPEDSGSAPAAAAGTSAFTPSELALKKWGPRYWGAVGLGVLPLAVLMSSFHPPWDSFGRMLIGGAIGYGVGKLWRFQTQITAEKSGMARPRLEESSTSVWARPGERPVAGELRTSVMGTAPEEPIIALWDADVPSSFIAGTHFEKMVREKKGILFSSRGLRLRNLLVITREKGSENALMFYGAIPLEDHDKPLESSR